MLENLNDRLRGLCGSVDWNTGYVIESRDGLFKIEKNGNFQFSSASIIKLNILWSVYKKISDGLLNAGITVNVTEQDVTGGSGVLRYLNPGHVLTVRELCRLMIDFSDNTATNILINLLGMDFINSDINKCGLKNTVLQRCMMDMEARAHGADNLTTPEDTVQIIKLIETSDEIKERLRLDMLDILFEQNCSHYLPHYMPPKFKFAHKSGGLDDVLHDAGIIVTDNGQRFYTAVMTSGFSAREEGLSFINHLGSEIFEALSYLSE